MARLSKIQRSNKAHMKLERFHNNRANNSSDDTPRCFYSIVKRDYHDKVAKEQGKLGKILSRSAKKSIYEERKRNLANYNKWYNESFNPRADKFVPKKYR